MSASNRKRSYLRSRSPSGPGGLNMRMIGRRAGDRGLALAIMVQRTLQGIVMSGRRSLIKGYFWRCAGRGCGHVFGLRRIGSAGPDVVR